MKSNRTFTRKNEKLEIKQVVEEEIDTNIAMPGIAKDQMYQGDKINFLILKKCAFVRTYIPGEYDGFTLPPTLDLKEITHTLVVIAGAKDIDPKAGEQHVLAHLQPLSDTYKIIVFDMEHGKPSHARIPLLPEQAKVIIEDLEKGHN